MSDIHLVLTPAERDLLVQILDARLKEKRVEARRTEFSRDFRHQLEEEATHIHDLLERLSPPAGVR